MSKRKVLKYRTILTFDQIVHATSLALVLLRGKKPPLFMGNEIEYEGKLLTAEKLRQIGISFIRVRIMDGVQRRARP